jgi:AraC family transcriptional regulator
LRSDIERVVAYMYDRHSEPISLADMAEVARLSQFHFSRMFAAATGVSPGRFLSAIRLHQAKTLLLTTSETVTDISYTVGYNSLGTFTSRFTKSVGIPPMQFRRTSGLITGIPGVVDTTECCPLSGERDARHAFAAGGRVHGRLWLPEGQRLTRAYLGLFDSAIAQGPLLAGAVLDDSPDFELPYVPEGEWYLLAAGFDAGDPCWPDEDAQPAQLIGREGPFKVVDGGQVEVRLTMRAVRSTDPPILLALPDLETPGRARLVDLAR